MATYFHIRKPRPGGAWVLSEQTRAKDGSSSYRSLSLPELDAINRAYKAGTHSFEEALAQVKALQARLTRETKGHREKPVTLAENLKLFEAYWKAEYADRDLVDPDSARVDLLRSIRELGSISLLVASRQELYQALDHLTPNKQRRTVARLNQLLRFAGRDVRVRPKRAEFKEVRYLTSGDVAKLANLLKHPFDTLTKVAFLTGLRVGEIFGLTERSILGPHIVVNSQIDKNLKRRQTKNRKERKVFPIAGGLEAVRAWLAISDRMSYRQARFAEIVGAKAEALWPKEPRKHVTFHDLRHSYAIEMLRLGASLSEVALLLGDHVTVCQTYYTGFSLTDEGIEALAARLS